MSQFCNSYKFILLHCPAFRKTPILNGLYFGHVLNYEECTTVATPPFVNNFNIIDHFPFVCICHKVKFEVWLLWISKKKGRCM